MSQESKDASETGEADQPGRREGAGVAAVPSSLRDALRPWVDVDEVGISGLWTWLGTIVPLLPAPEVRGGPPFLPDRLSTPDQRVSQLAAALTDCARDRARLNFRAYEYYSDNTVLARRVHALEGMLRNQEGGRDLSPPDAETERATERYLPRRRGGPSP